MYYTTTADLIAALQAGKIDAMVNSMAVGTLAAHRYSDLTAEFSPIINRLREDGTIDELWDKWTAGDEGDKTVPEQDWAGANGTLSVAARESLEPVSYFGDGQMLGFEIETLLIVAEELDVHLEFTPMEFAEVLAYLQSSKSDLGCGSILITEERAEAMDFAPTHENDLVMVVRSVEGEEAGGSGIFDSLKTSFEKTFIIEDRWKLILSGLGVTVAITLASTAMGTILGFITLLLRRNGNRLAETFVSAFEGLIIRMTDLERKPRTIKGVDL